MNHTAGPVDAVVVAHNHGKPIGNEGLFLSHAYLGTFMLGLGMWWWIQALRHCYSSVRIGMGKYAAQITYGSGCCPNHMSEGMAKVILCLIGMGMEAGTISFGRHHDYAYYPFYTAMLMAGLIDIITSTRVFLPEGLDYVAHILPFTFQAYFMRAQAYDQPHLTATCRHLASYVGGLTAASILGEMVSRHQFLFSWIKCFTVMLSGAWFWQSGILLNPPLAKPWVEDSHDNVMYAAILCAWQMFFVSVIQLCILIVAAKCHGTSTDWTQIAGTRSESMDRYGTPLHSDLRHDVQYTKLLNSDNVDE
ncbi:Transmembrane protein 45B [Fasciola hepatica]|uniref:Transmembrane protein 45B n=1 Tax=Fasciola hepatica TaxID=6192 RepID=A0A2H1C579_FASHE|nr:Transmembrane protein 45B [Fasciola hepatica]